MLALGTSADLEIGGPIRVNVRGKEQLIGVVTNRSPVGEFDDGKTVIEDFKCGFLPFSIKDVTHNKHRLSLPLDAQIAQGTLRGSRAGELAAGTGSDCRHYEQSLEIRIMESMYHRAKNGVKV